MSHIIATRPSVTGHLQLYDNMRMAGNPVGTLPPGHGFRVLGQQAYGQNSGVLGRADFVEELAGVNRLVHAGIMQHHNEAPQAFSDRTGVTFVTPYSPQGSTPERAPRATVTPGGAFDGAPSGTGDVPANVGSDGGGGSKWLILAGLALLVLRGKR